MPSKKNCFITVQKSFLKIYRFIDLTDRILKYVSFSRVIDRTWTEDNETKTDIAGFFGLKIITLLTH